MNLGGMPAPRGRGADTDGPDNTTCPPAAPSLPYGPCLGHTVMARSRSKG